MSTTSSGAPPGPTNANDVAQEASGISLYAFAAALAVSLVIFAIQIGLFLLFRNRLARILYVRHSPFPMSFRLLTSCLAVNQRHTSFQSVNALTPLPQVLGI